MSHWERVENLAMGKDGLEVLSACEWMIVELFADGLKICAAADFAWYRWDRVGCCFDGEAEVAHVG